MDGPSAPRPTMEWFCGRVCSYVRFWPDHPAISAELTSHMEDHRDALLEAAPSMLLREAEADAVRSMGDPEELGRWLDKIHDPRLGWFQIWFRRVVWALSAAILVFALPRAGKTAARLALIPQEDHQHDPRTYLTERFPPEELAALYPADITWKDGSYTYTVEQVAVTEDETGRDIHCLLRVGHLDPRLREPAFWDELRATDDTGAAYLSLQEAHDLRPPSQLFTTSHVSVDQSILSSPFASYYCISAYNVDPAATQVDFLFDRYGAVRLYLPIPVEGGGSLG